MDVNDKLFGKGILCEGEVITSPEQQRLIAKRAWIQLFKLMCMNDERDKARWIPIPWYLENDHEIQELVAYVQGIHARFDSREAYMDYLTTISEEHYDEKVIEEALRLAPKMPRQQWCIRQIAAENPKTILDIGSGYGDMAIALARKGFQVTGIAPSETTMSVLEPIIEEEKLAVQFVNGLFEYLDFGERKFDVVFAGEVLEHVQDDVGFLLKCCSIAEKAVVVTTPVGSCDHGFIRDAAWKRNSEHVRAYSPERFKALIRAIDGWAPYEYKQGGDPFEYIASTKGHTGQFIHCFCAKLVRDHGRKSTEPGVVHPIVAGEGEAGGLHHGEVAGPEGEEPEPGGERDDREAGGEDLSEETPVATEPVAQE